MWNAQREQGAVGEAESRYWHLPDFDSPGSGSLTSLTDPAAAFCPQHPIHLYTFPCARRALAIMSLTPGHSPCPQLMYFPTRLNFSDIF